MDASITMTCNGLLWQKIKDVSWKVHPYITPNNPDKLTIDVECMYDHDVSNLWSFDAEISVVAHLNYRKIHSETTYSFNNKSKNVTIEIEAIEIGRELIFIAPNISIKSDTCIGAQTTRVTKFFKPLTVDSAVVLYVGDCRLNVDKYALMSSSKVFRELLSEANEIKIPNVNYDRFVNFLQILYRDDQSIRDFNVVGLLELAEKFEVDFLISECEEFLITTKQTSNDCKLRIARTNGLEKLQAATLDRIAKVEMQRLTNLGKMPKTAVLRKSCGDMEQPETKRKCE